MVRSLVVLVGILAFLATVPASAQRAVLSQLYGDGVHAYFAGDYRQAHKQFTAAIDGGTQDPRVFYFRGLAYLKLGRPQEAAVDFRRGALLETRNVGQRYQVAQALQRVQGDVREQLETYRAQARKAAVEAAQRLRQARFEALKCEEQRVLQLQAEAAKMPPEIIALPPGAIAEQPEVVRTEEPTPEQKAGAENGANPFDTGVEITSKTGDENPFEGSSPAAATSGKKGIFGALRGAVSKTITSGAKPPAGAPPLPAGLGGLIPMGSPAGPGKAEAPAGVNPFGEIPAQPGVSTGEKKSAAEPPAHANPFAET
ncbi:MAG: hypothetical protein JXB10_10745, partial [Pirellulales bacterium]|nr:hypothetical protein [Pirellulales bacterium]